MNYYKHIIILLAALLSILPMESRAGFTPRFEQFPTNNICIYASYRDADGILWLGTSKGLMTYAQLQSTFQPNNRYKEQLNNIITEIRQDAAGRLWLKTQALRYIVYNPKTNECITDVDGYLHQLGVNFTYQFYVYIDSRGCLWAFKDGRLFFKDFKSGTSKHLSLPTSAGQITKLTDDGKRLVIVTSNAVYELKGTALRRIAATLEPITKEYTYMTLDKGGNLWVAANMKLMSMSFADRQWHVHPEVKPDINGVLCLPDGHVCVSTTNNGLYVYDSAGHLYKNVMQTGPTLDGLQNSHLQSIYYDKNTSSLIISYHKQGMSLWTGMEQNGIQKLHVQSAEHGNIVEDVIAFASLGSDIIIGTEDNGIYKLSSDGAILENKYPGCAATAILCDSKCRVWTGLYHGGVVGPDGRRLFPDQSPYNIIQPTPNPDLLFIVLNGEGIRVVNTLSGDIKNVPTDNPWIMDMVECNGKLFAATPKYLYIIDPQTLNIRKVDARRFSTSSGFSNGTKDLAADSRGRVWIVSYKDNSDISVYDTHTGKVSSVTQLRRYNIKAIAEDNDGNMWCTTDKGLVCMSRTCKATLFADKSLYNDRALYRLADGRMVAGTTDGYEVFNPGKLLQSGTVVPENCPLILASLHINGNNVSLEDSVDGRPLVGSDLPYVQKLDLAYNENNIILEYLPRDMGPHKPEAWYYRIDGLSLDDQPLIGGRITLANLSPGTYTVEIFNDNTHAGQFSYKMLTIHIARPWWLSWWAFMIYSVVIALTIYFICRYRHRRTLYRRRINDMREKARQQKALDEMKLNFFTNISHDLRMPLTLIITPVEELLEKAKDRETQSILSLVSRNAKHLYALVNQILDFRKINSDASKLNLEDTDIVNMVRDIVGSFSLMAKSKGVDLSFSSSDERLVMAIDVDKITKVVMNLLSNAFKYAPKGGFVKVILNTDGKQVEIRVADDGPSIPQNMRAHIFDRYYTTGSNSGKHDSYGLGLSIVHDYVLLHHGTISVDDLTPKGTVFKVRLPVTMKGVSFVAPRQVIEQHPSDSESSKPSGKTLLLVEDNADLLAYLTHLLEGEYTVCQATDGRQALDIMRTTSVDIVVSDVMMAGMDGLELCREIKNNIDISHIPVILLTAKALDADQLKGLRIGADDYITKPFNFEILRQRIHNMLQRTELAHVRFSKDIEIKPSDIAVSTLDEELIKKAILIVENNIANTDFTVDDLANEIGMHRTNLYKKILAITGKTPLQFIRCLRMKRAHQLMGRGGVLVSQVAYEVGFNSPKIFARYFKEEYGIYPSEFMKDNESNGMEK